MNPAFRYSALILATITCAACVTGWWLIKEGRPFTALFLLVLALVNLGIVLLCLQHEKSRLKPPLHCWLPGCSRQRVRELVMCSKHWMLLPRELRDRIRAARASGNNKKFTQAFTDAERHLQGRVR